MNRLSRFLTVVAITLLSQAANADPMDGDWKVFWRCEGSTEDCRESGAVADGDFFLLRLRQTGTSVCGYHIITAHRMKKVDDGGEPDLPSIGGHVTGSLAYVTFRTGDEKVGRAIIWLANNKLYWRIKLQPGGESYFPETAVLLKQPESTYAELPQCDRVDGEAPNLDSSIGEESPFRKQWGSCCCSTPEIGSCMREANESQERELNRMYSKLMEQLSEAADVKGRHALIEAQRAWVAFRDRDCKATSILNDGGFDVQGCLFGHAENRIKDLKAYLGESQP